MSFRPHLSNGEVKVYSLLNKKPLQFGNKSSQTRAYYIKPGDIYCPIAAKSLTGKTGEL